MTMTKLKLSWSGSDWTLSIEGDTGTSIAHSMTTITRVLSALEMGGFAVLLAVQEGTSIHLLGTKYAPATASNQRLALNRINATGQTFGSVSTHYNPMLRECQSQFSTNLDGVGSQEASVSLQGYSSHTSTRTEARLNSSRLDTTTLIEDLLLRQDALQRFMDENACDTLVNTCALPREAEIQLSSECVEYLRSHYPQLRVNTYSFNSERGQWERVSS